MKKIVDKFLKPIKGKENFYTINKSEEPETDRSTRLETRSPSDVYKNFDFDDYISKSVCFPHDLITKSQSDISHKSSQNLGLFLAPQCLSSSSSSSSSSSTSSSQSNSLNVGVKDRNDIISKDQGDLESKNQLRRYNSNSESVCSDFMNSVLVDNVGLNIERNGEKYQRLKERKPERSNTYVISINNSKHFHIGSQETFNVSDCIIHNLKGLKFTKNGTSTEQIEFDLNELLDSDARLTKHYIILISKHLNGQWKEFGKDLGLDESYLDDLDVRNDGNSSLIVYDSLQNYVSQFPNTTLGFVISLLKKINQINLIRILAERIMNELESS